jgi:hypothetical protein
MGLTLDSPLPASVLDEIERVIGTERAHSLVLPS